MLLYLDMPGFYSVLLCHIYMYVYMYNNSSSSCFFKCEKLFGSLTSSGISFSHYSFSDIISGSLQLYMYFLTPLPTQWHCEKTLMVKLVWETLSTLAPFYIPALRRTTMKRTLWPTIVLRQIALESFYYHTKWVFQGAYFRKSDLCWYSLGQKYWTWIAMGIFFANLSNSKFSSRFMFTDSSLWWKGWRDRGFYCPTSVNC